MPSKRFTAIAVKTAVFVTAFSYYGRVIAPGALILKIFTSDPAVIAEGDQISAHCCVFICYDRDHAGIPAYYEKRGTGYLFYFQSFWASVMGVSGAALGTLCARILEVVLVAGYAHLFNKDIKLRLRYVIQIDKVLFSDFMKYALLVVSNEVMCRAWNYSKHCDPGPYGKPCGSGKLCGSGGKADCNGLFHLGFPARWRSIWER